MQPNTKSQHKHSLVIQISLGMLALPVPRIATSIIQRVLRLPLQHLRRFVDDGVGIRTVSLATSTENLLQLEAASLLHASDHLKHGGALSRSQIEHVVPLESAALHVLQCLDVSLGDVHHVDVIANARTVGCIVVSAEHVDVVLLADGDLLQERH